MTDLLTQRIKAAKRELTALKTAHRRGIGLLKLYESDVSLDVQERLGFWSIEVTINFAEGQSPYPFLQWIPVVDNDTSNVIELVGEEFTNNGMTVVLYFEWLASDPYVDTINFLSTSIIDNYSQEWSQ